MAVTIVRTTTSSQIGSLLTQASASTTYLTQASASTTYLTQASASITYLNQTSASTTYLTQASASTTYLPLASASTTYLPLASASSTYLTQTSASTTYLPLASASSTYLTQTSASTTYAPKASPVFTGIATNPTVPAFNVYSSFVSTQSGNLTYNATNSNNGGHMNLGTGLFTAPVSGYYHFNYYGFIDTGLSGNTTITFQKNGSGFPSRGYNDFNDTSYGPVITISAVIYLATNDNVRVNITGAGVHGNDSSFFSGFLIG